MSKKNVNKDLLENFKSIQNNMKLYMHDYFKQYELTPPQGMLVFILNKHQQLKISDISKKMGLSNSTVSSLVDRLEGQGLVERIRSDKDRRVVWVQLSKEMNSCLNSHQDLLENLIKEALVGFSMSEKNLLVESLEKFSGKIREVVKEKSND